MKKAAVILGAGASADVSNGTAQVIDSDLRPPLARELFDLRFWRFRRSYRGAEVLGSELGRLAQNQAEPFNLEARLTDYANSRDPRTRRHFKDIPPYLRDILWQATLGYAASPSNYINLVRRLLQDRTHEILFVLLNYDTLLEQALERYDPQLAWRELGDYVAADRQARVVKVHGSVDWAVPMPETGASWDLSLDTFEPTRAPGESIVIDRRGEASRDWRADGGRAYLYPRITAPLAEKTLCCPLSHEAALREFLRECNKFLMIGTSALDSDLLKVLDEACPPGENFLLCVNQTPDATQQMRLRFQRAVRAFNSTMVINSLPDGAGGLLAFLDTDSIERFLAVD